MEVGVRGPVESHAETPGTMALHCRDISSGLEETSGLTSSKLLILQAEKLQHTKIQRDQGTCLEF